MVATVKTEPQATNASIEQRGATPGTAQQGVSHGAPSPLTPEELADRLVPEDPRLSPDGRTVVFAVAPRGRRGEHKDQALWLSRDGEPARPFTAGTAHDANPRWSPSGDRILFCSDRAARMKQDEAGSKGDKDEHPYRLYLIDPAGGEARPLGDLQGELTLPSWSPDGRTVAVLRTDPATAEEKARKEAKDDRIVADEDPKLSRLWVLNVETGRARCLTHGARQVWAYAWAPDGEHLAIATTATPDLDDLFGPYDLSLVPWTGGLSRHVATFPLLPATPVFVDLPEGPAIAVQASGHRADPSDSVWVVPVAGGEPRKLLPDHEGVVEGLVPRGGTGGMAVRLVERTHSKVYGVGGDGTLTPLTPGGRHGRGSVMDGPSFSADGSRLALVWSDGSTPEEVWVGAAGGDGQAVTSLGAPFRGRLQPVEVVGWTSTDGVEVEGLLTYPAGYEPGKRYPLVVEVHGGPWWQWEERAMLDWHDWAQQLASHGYAVLAPNPRGSTGYGSAFQAMLQEDIGGGEAQDLISGAQAMVERGVADPDRLGIGGWSWGGYLTAWTITQTRMFRAAVMGAGLANVVSDHGTGDIPSFNLHFYAGLPYANPEEYWSRSPIRYVANVTTPTLILHGDADGRVHPSQGMEYHRALKSLGVPVEFVRYPREGHSIGERAHQIDLMRRLVAWYDRWLKG